MPTSWNFKSSISFSLHLVWASYPSRPRGSGPSHVSVRMQWGFPKAPFKLHRPLLWIEYASSGQGLYWSVNHCCVGDRWKCKYRVQGWRAQSTRLPLMWPESKIEGKPNCWGGGGGGNNTWFLWLQWTGIYRHQRVCWHIAFKSLSELADNLDNYRWWYLFLICYIDILGLLFSWARWFSDW